MTASPPVVPAGGSLRVRMLLSASLVLIGFLTIMGLVLDNANRQTAEQRVAERLQLHIYALLAASQESMVDGQFTLTLPSQLQEPLFNRLGTGLYGIAFYESSYEIWRSESALEVVLSDAERARLLADAEPGVPVFGQLPATGRHQGLFYLTYPVIWQIGDTDARFQFIVLEDMQPFVNEVQAFRAGLWAWLAGGLLVLVAVQALIMIWGLSPIARLESDLKEMEQGDKQYLEGSYPREISGVTSHFNQLLANERRQQEQYRTTLADLAHSLKTPLAILKTEAQGGEGAASPALVEQVDRMNEIVSYQLERAVSSASTLVRKQTRVAPVVDKLVGTLHRVYADRDIRIVSEVQPVSLPMDERDLMEVAGNLLDNACKYGDGEVRISAGADCGLYLVVEDNGGGIAPSHRGQVLQRGARLDTRESGQGIGLSVVAEIAGRYSGDISIDDSPLGGARVTLRFGDTG